MANVFQRPKFEFLRDGNANASFLDKIPIEMYDLVDSYWYKFSPLEPIYFYVISCIITFLGLMSVSGNFLVIYIFVSTRGLRTPSNMYVVNLALSDFMMMFTMFPPVVLNGYYETWSLGPFLCEVYGFLGSLFGCTSIWSMTLIACDRYNVIVKGLKQKPLTVNLAVMKLAFIWSACFAWAFFPFIGWNRYVPEGNMTACGTDYFAKDWFNKSYIIFYTVWAYCIPLLTIIYSYYFILKVVREHEKTMRDQAKKMNVASLRNEDANAQSAEIKLAKVALCTITLWFIAWTPYSIINLAGITGALDLSPLATICGSIFAKAGAVYNPIVYGLSHPKFQAELNKRVPCLACKKNVPNATDNKTLSTVECESNA